MGKTIFKKSPLRQPVIGFAEIRYHLLSHQLTRRYETWIGLMWTHGLAKQNLRMNEFVQSTNESDGTQITQWHDGRGLLKSKFQDASYATHCLSEIWQVYSHLQDVSSFQILSTLMGGKIRNPQLFVILFFSANQWEFTVAKKQFW